MQKAMQIRLDDSTEIPGISRKPKIKFDKHDLSQLGIHDYIKLEKAKGFVDFALLDKLSRKYILIEAKSYPSEWFDASGLSDFRWICFDLEKPSLSKVAVQSLERFKQEKEAFLRIKSELLESERYLGEFVAIHEGQIVDHDRDNVALAQRVYSRYGYIPIYIDKVKREREIVELPSPEG